MLGSTFLPLPLHAAALRASLLHVSACTVATPWSTITTHFCKKHTAKLPSLTRPSNMPGRITAASNSSPPSSLCHGDHLADLWCFGARSPSNTRRPWTLPTWPPTSSLRLLQAFLRTMAARTQRMRRSTAIHLTQIRPKRPRSTLGI